ncbi:PP2C family protein-serine/threonine phosphatase [Streptomyces broussonetiae]|uniref:PP2C family protein-serine/threonine phosphatase n=1 Tax=Streptomyces broussonetiae TaxID=2686304 RepID=UPI001E551D5A|nr:PP2C family protein-serine/threonine phosphatase [Streptomyces broussonetiae]
MVTVHKLTSGSVMLSWLPVAAMAVVAAADVVAGPGVGFLPLVSLGPAFSGLVGGWRRTALIGAVALLVCVGLGLYDGLFEERRGFTAMASVAGVTAAGIAAAVMRLRREAELASVRSVAEVAQRVLLRPVPRTAGPLQAAVSYTSAVAEARIGGDLYEVVASPHGIRAIVGMCRARGWLRWRRPPSCSALSGRQPTTSRTWSGWGRGERSVARELEGEKFVTAVLAEFGSEYEAVFLNYGHPAPLVVRESGSVDFAQPPSFALPLGLGAHGGEGPRPYRVVFAPGDQLLLYTDGVTEARDPGGSFYPLGDRAGLLKEPDADRALEALREDLVRHAAGPLHDDAAMLLLRYHDHAG